MTAWHQFEEIAFHDKHGVVFGTITYWWLINIFCKEHLTIYKHIYIPNDLSSKNIKFYVKMFIKYL